MPIDRPNPIRQVFRSHQRDEFNSALAAAARDPEMLLTVEEVDGTTVATIHRSPVRAQAVRP